MAVQPNGGVTYRVRIGVTRVGLDYGVPIANAILTTENEAQALARQHDKGRDAAQVAVEMARLMERLI
jgi:6,7-dimethyl-8-ribityllumazine synthase